jgi:hypothetical protein
MTANIHPSSSELLVALREPELSAPTLEHIDECLACRIRQASGPATVSADSIQRIVEASAPLPEVLADLLSGDQDLEPQPNEIWRVGRSEALLVWVRRVFEDDVADVIPLVLDIELADHESVVVGAEATSLAAETAAMVSLRTHVHTGAFLNRIGVLDIGKDVTEVMTAVQEGRRPSRVRVGPPIDDDDDQRLEFRQALRDLLAELSPSAWLAAQDDPAGVEQRVSESTANCSSNEIDVIGTELGERLWGVQCRTLEAHVVKVNAVVRAKSVLKVMYLDTTVLVATFHGTSLTAFPDTRAVATACQKLTLIETDVDAVAVAIPRDEWPTLLFTTGHMRTAIVLPRGCYEEPTATMRDYGLVETLCKHLEGAMPVWEVTEQASNRIGRTDFREIAVRHASTSIEKITADGKRARQAAKQTAWGSLPDELDEQVARFVVAVANRETVDEALVEFGLETHDD